MINFKKVTDEKYYCGIRVDDTYQIFIDHIYAGLLYINHMPTNSSIYLEFVQLNDTFIHSGYFTEILSGIFTLYPAADAIYFRCTDDLYPMYKHLQAEIIERDKFAEVTEMKIRKDTLDLKKYLSSILPALEKIRSYEENENTSYELNEVLADVQNLYESIRRLYPHKKES